MRNRTVVNNKIGVILFVIKLKLLFNLVMSNLMSNLNPVIITFGIERGVFLKEENARMYTTWTYFIGK